MWASVDKPFEVRVPESFAFGVKKIMVTSVWAKNAAYVDVDAGTLYLEEYLADPVIDEHVAKFRAKVQTKGRPSKSVEKGKGKGSSAKSS